MKYLIPLLLIAQLGLFARNSIAQAMNLDSSPYNMQNSSYNMENSPSNMRNSPYNMDNSAYNASAKKMGFTTILAIAWGMRSRRLAG